MAKRDKHKTSLGNALDGDNNIVGFGGQDRQGTTARWRSFSDKSHHESRQKKLFGSLREAMEHEAAEEKAFEAVDVSAASAVLDARTLSTLEKTQADEAGYTVIRRRAVSDLSDQHDASPRVDRRAGRGQESSEKGRQVGRSKRSDGLGGGGGGNRSKPTNSTQTGQGRGSKPKRSQQQHKQAAPPQEPPPRELWKKAVVGRSQLSETSQHPITSPADCSSDAQRWLEAASFGAVVPAASLPAASPSASAGGTQASDWHAPPSPSWLANKPNPAAEDLREANTSQQPTEEEAAYGIPSAASEKLHESMLSWLEGALSLDATHRSPP